MDKLRQLIREIILNEIKISLPSSPKFDSNDEFYEYILNNNNFRILLINTIFEQWDGGIYNNEEWDYVKYDWCTEPIERPTELNRGNGIMIGKNDRIYISIKPITSDYLSLFKIELYPNEFYCGYY
jgi:hypothetical protein